MTKHEITVDNGFATYKRLMSFVRKQAFTVPLVFAVFGAILYGAVDAAFTYILKPLLDQGFVAKDQQFIRWLPLLLILLFVLRGIGNFLSSYFIAWVGRGVVLEFRRCIFQHLLHMPAWRYDKIHSAELLSSVVYNSEQVANASTDALITLLHASAMLIGLCTVMLLSSWQLTLIYLLILPFVSLLVRNASRRMRQLNLLVQHAIAHVTHVTQEAIEGYKVIRLFAAQKHEHDKFSHAISDNKRLEMKLVITRVLSSSATQLLVASALAFTIYLAMSPQSLLSISAGSFTSLIAAMFAMLKPMKDLSTVNSTIQRGLAGAQSIFYFLDQPQEDDRGTVQLDRVRGDIVFDNVCFSYPHSTQATLHHVNLNIRAGQTIAIIGRSGSGKTSLANLLPRFYEVTQGDIYLDGHNLRDIRLSDLRHQFSWVAQQVVLFNDTIANNIAYPMNTTITTQHIETAARQAQAWEFIEKLPLGLDTPIGENGTLLSGGQRQRIAIARALLKNAPILLLDEATSALDSEAEHLIQLALQQLMHQRTTLVIAHRLSTIENADWILVLDNGHVIEQGTHRELLQQGGHYARAHALQFNEVNTRDTLLV